MLSEPERDDELWALVPIKELTRAKKRLEACLGKHRPGLCMAMFRDVLNALAQSRKIYHTVVVTADAEAAKMSESIAALHVEEVESIGMISAIELGIDAIQSMGGHNIVILPADIPLLTGDEIDRLIESFAIERQRRGGKTVGISPSKDNKGTNLLYFSTDHQIPLRYGPDSYQLHRQAASEQLIEPIPLHSTAISLDIDEQMDLDEFIAYCAENPVCQQTETWKFLQKRGYSHHAEAVKRMQQ